MFCVLEINGKRTKKKKNKVNKSLTVLRRSAHEISILGEETSENVDGSNHAKRENKLRERKN